MRLDPEERIFPDPGQNQAQPQQQQASTQKPLPDQPKTLSRQ